MPRSIRRLFIIVLAVQAAHLVEHLVQLYQTYVLHLPVDRALGLLGYLIDFHKGAAWLHLGFNLTLVTSLLWMVPDIRNSIASRPRVNTYLALGCGVEVWHIVEHLSIAGHLIANGHCPCPGVITFVPDMPLHLAYNIVVFIGMLAVARPIIREETFGNVLPLETTPRWLSQDERQHARVS
ncbi:MAG: hypothetical protein NVSMB57_15400 [Actinomycetota bacterium]